jgi:hypothetical protein
MKKEGFEPTVDFDIGLFMDKTFTTYRKGKVHNENIFFRWNPFNLINKHFTRSTDQIFDVVSSTLYLTRKDDGEVKRSAKTHSSEQTQPHFKHRQ